MNARPIICTVWIFLLFTCPLSYAGPPAIGTKSCFIKVDTGTNIEEISARLLVNRFSFTPTANPKPGEAIKLKIELMNAGSSASPATTAQFHLPAGVSAHSSLRTAVPALGAGQAYTIEFYFSYSSSFTANTIAIVFEMPSITGLAGLKKTLYISINSQKRSVPRTQGNEVYWVSPDPDETQGVIKTGQKQVDLKVMALSSGELSKKDFSIRVNGRRAQGSKTDLSKLKSSSADDLRTNHSFTSSLQLEEGRNEVEVIYYEKDGETIAAKTRTFVFYYEPPVKSNVYVLTIGAEWPSLAKNVARAFKGAFPANDSGIAQTQFFNYTSAKLVERMALIKGIAQLERLPIQDNDWVIVYLAAKSRPSEDHEYVLQPSDFDENYPVITGLDLDRDIIRELQKVGGKKILFLDLASESGLNPEGSPGLAGLIQATAPSIEVLAVDNALVRGRDSKAQGVLGQALLEAINNTEVETHGDASIRADEGDQKLSLEELSHFLHARINYLMGSTKGILHKKGTDVPRERPFLRLGQ